MSKAKEEYNVFEDSIPEEHKTEYYKNKIKLLQQWNKELEDLSKLNYNMFTHAEKRIEILEEQNREMLDELINISKLHYKYVQDESAVTKDMMWLLASIELDELIEKITGKSIDEVLKDE